MEVKESQNVEEVVENEKEVPLEEQPAIENEAIKDAPVEISVEELKQVPLQEIVEEKTAQENDETTYYEVQQTVIQE